MPSEDDLDEQVRACEQSERPAPLPLTAKQVEALKWASHGLDVRGIAEAMRVDRRTAATHLARGRRKLAAKNTAHAVAVAFRLGLID